ncbi:hypothetical protein LTR93_011377 [Exophiala xenobiotica]|nr:hypothetical protein LTR93_011377 [Exophiala xenobiotica]
MAITGAANASEKSILSTMQAWLLAMSESPSRSLVQAKVQVGPQLAAGYHFDSGPFTMGMDYSWSTGQVVTSHECVLTPAQWRSAFVEKFRIVLTTRREGV